MHQKDIIIIGGGPAGLSFARCLKETSLDIVIIEKQPEATIADPAYDGRETALTHLTKEILTRLGVWERFPDNYPSLIKEAKVMDGDSPYALHFDHRDICDETLGYLVSNHAIRKALYEEVLTCDNVSLLCDTTVKHTTTHLDKGLVTLESGEVYTAPLVIAADTRFSAARKHMGIKASTLDFKRTAILSVMRHDYSHNETAYEYFRYDNTMAILPMQNNHSSIVLTMPSDSAKGLLAQDSASFTNFVQSQLNSSLGDMELVSKRFTYPLVGVLAERFFSHRFALLGDAAVGMHPVTAHGFNLGLSGAHYLANKITSAHNNNNDIGHRDILEAYHNEHKKTSYPLYHGTNAIVKLYTNNTPAPKLLRKAMLRMGNHITPAKKRIMHQLTDVDAISGL